jgi:uncharacterized membrane protein HdeD (DUF308 family)
MSDPEVPEITPAEAKEVRKGGGAALFLGVLLIILGLFVMGVPHIAGLAKVIVVGAFLAVGGMFEIVGAFTGSEGRSKLLSMLGGILSLVCGAMLLARPMLGLYVITIVLIAYFLVDGLSRIVFSLQLQPEQGWGLLLFSGIVTVVLAVMIWKQLPEAALWVVGLLVGIRILFAGITMITLGSAVRAVVPKPAS